jgi:anti-anti-sigma factor
VPHVGASYRVEPAGVPLTPHARWTRPAFGRGTAGSANGHPAGLRKADIIPAGSIMKRTLQISEREVDGVTILDLQGRLVLDETEFFRRRIDELVRQNRLQIVLNLKAVTYIDSAGVGMMVGKYLTVRRLGGDVKLLHLSPRSFRLMTITKLLTVFEAFDSEERAVAAFATAQH